MNASYTSFRNFKELRAYGGHSLKVVAVVIEYQRSPLSQKRESAFRGT
jgi:hypothetical protein